MHSLWSRRTLTFEINFSHEHSQAGLALFWLDNYSAVLESVLCLQCSHLVPIHKSSTLSPALRYASMASMLLFFCAYLPCYSFPFLLLPLLSQLNQLTHSLLRSFNSIFVWSTSMCNLLPYYSVQSTMVVVRRRLNNQRAFNSLKFRYSYIRSIFYIQN